MGNSERLWPDLLVEHSFSRLTSIELISCDKLLNVFPLSMLTRLQRLHTLLIDSCESVEEIIYECGPQEGGSSSPQFIQSDVISFEFPAMTSLTLEYLPNLKSIHHNKMHTINWPSLEKMEVTRCRAVEILFASGETSSQQPLFWVNEVILPMLVELEISGMHNLEQLWPDLLVEHSFSRLTSIHLQGCPKLLNVFPLSMLTRLQRLDYLRIWSCESVEEIIYECGPQEGGSSSPQFIQSDVISFEFPAMTSLTLEYLPNLKSIHHNKMHTINWPSLEKMEVTRCRAVEILFASGETSSQQPLFWVNEVILPMLVELEISGMHNLEQLWPDLLVEHSFSRLTSIHLQGCPKLLNVFPLSMLTRLQRLDYLRIWSCESVEEIIYECGPQEGGNSSPQFIQSDVISFQFPALTSLELLDMPNLRSIHHNKMHTINWPSLKRMEVRECRAVEIPFASGETSSEQPLFWVTEYTFPKLYKLTLNSNAGIKEIIFQSEEGGEEKPASLLLSQIHALDVIGCSGLKANLVPSSVSFLNLVTLEVERCHGIIKLFTHSTAKSLVQLREMYIKNCENIEEIMQGGDDDDDEISFAQLNQLELGRLPKLESFCSSKKYTFEFRSLKYLQVHNCPNMKMFSEGDARTPLLHKVLIRDYGSEGRWEGSLNSTIQELFREKHTIWTSSDSEESENYEEECETKEDQDNPSTSNTQAITEIAGDDTTR